MVENLAKSDILSSQTYETDQIPDEFLYELQENVDRPSNQVDELTQKAPRLQIEFESLANGEYKRPKQNVLQQHDKIVATSPGPNIFLDEIPLRIPDSGVSGTNLEEISRSTGDFYEF